MEPRIPLSDLEYGLEDEHAVLDMIRWRWLTKWYLMVSRLLSALVLIASLLLVTACTSGATPINAPTLSVLSHTVTPTRTSVATPTELPTATPTEMPTAAPTARPHSPGRRGPQLR
jgi:hypothetical protein